MKIIKKYQLSLKYLTIALALSLCLVSGSRAEADSWRGIGSAAAIVLAGPVIVTGAVGGPVAFSITSNQVTNDELPTRGALASQFVFGSLNILAGTFALGISDTYHGTILGAVGVASGIAILGTGLWGQDKRHKKLAAQKISLYPEFNIDRQGNYTAGLGLRVLAF